MPYTKKDGEDAGKLAEEMESLANRIGKNDATKEEREVLERYLRELVKGLAAGLPERLAPVLGRTGLVPPTDASLRATQRLRFVDRGLAAREPMPLSLLSDENADIGTLAAAQPRDWRAMFIVPKLQSAEQPYILQQSAGGLVAFAVLVHAPYEVVRIDIQRSEKRPTIAAVEILALH